MAPRQVRRVRSYFFKVRAIPLLQSGLYNNLAKAETVGDTPVVCSSPSGDEVSLVPSASLLGRINMRLMRVHVRNTLKGYHLTCEYKTPEGKRVKLGRGVAKNKAELVVAVDEAAIEAATRTRKPVIGGM